MRLEYSDWFEQNEGDLRDAYIDYLNNSKLQKIEDAVFWFEISENKLADKAKSAKAAFDYWCEARFQEYVEAVPEREEYEDR